MKRYKFERRWVHHRDDAARTSVTYKKDDDVPTLPDKQLKDLVDRKVIREVQNAPGGKASDAKV